MVIPAAGETPIPFTLPKFMEKSDPGVTERPPAADARVNPTAVWTFSEGLFRLRVTKLVLLLLVSAATKVTVAESAPEVAPAPLALATNNPRLMVKVPSITPGNGMTGVRAAGLVEMVEKLPPPL